MNKEIIFKPGSGGGMLLVTLLVLALSIAGFFTQHYFPAVVLGLAFFVLLSGFMVIAPNESRVLVFFGTYKGTAKENGFFWVNPLYTKSNVSLRAMNLNGQSIKVNDKLGNPIEIAAVIVWQIADTAAALFEVNDYNQFVKIQSEAAVRHLANTCPYDNIEDNEAEITLRGSAEKVNALLEQELTERLERAGIKILEARISHLAYAPEIAQAMLQRQQATAVVSARKQIVEGAVGMVEMALQRLSERKIVELDDERKAAMVSNLLVVLCSEKSANPVVNAGTLYH
jgi:regulator of protease activity HflC (stomatin/prohibitin superfamily)